MKRKNIEIAAAVLLFLAAAILTDRYGRSHRTFLSPPRIEAIRQPSDAFSRWVQAGVRGRTLVLFDRRLNAELDEGTFLFADKEFGGDFSLEPLCDDIGSGVFGPRAPSFACSVKGLNGFLRASDLFHLLQESGRTVELPEDMRHLPARVRRALAGQGSPSSGSALPDGSEAPDFIPPDKEYLKWTDVERTDVIRLNRWVLQSLFPLTCPAKARFYITPENYVLQAVSAGMVRAVYHVVPDAAWPDVEEVLGRYPAAHRTPDGFRMMIFEGTPVMILREEAMPAVGEAVLVNINGDLAKEGRGRSVPDMLRSGRLKADLITVSGKDARRIIARIEGS